MRCPLRKNPSTYPEFGYCYTNECALWDSTRHQCILLTVGRQLGKSDENEALTRLGKRLAMRSDGEDD